MEADEGAAYGAALLAGVGAGAGRTSTRRVIALVRELRRGIAERRNSRRDEPDAMRPTGSIPALRVDAGRQ